MHIWFNTAVFKVKVIATYPKQQRCKRRGSTETPLSSLGIEIGNGRKVQIKVIASLSEQCSVLLVSVDVVGLLRLHLEHIVVRFGNCGRKESIL
jgi:hypothetical protein